VGGREYPAAHTNIAGQKALDRTERNMVEILQYPGIAYMFSILSAEGSMTLHGVGNNFRKAKKR
jgi:hypothetical protein